MTPKSSGVRSTLLRQTARFLHVTGVLTLARPLLERTRITAEGGLRDFPFVRSRRRPSAQILIYHRVNDARDPYFGGVPVEVFRAQMEYIASRYRVLRLSDLARGLRSGSIPENAIAVTFDDGYRDNYVHAFPILRAAAVPATIFLATSVIDSRRQLWHDDIFSAFRETRALALQPSGRARIGGSLATVDDRLRLQGSFLAHVRTLDEMDRTNAILRLRDALGVGPPPDAPGLMLRWDEVQEMSRAGVEFGSHTATHPILSRMWRSQAQREIAESKRVLEERLGTTVEGFAYPNGVAADFTEETKAILEETGYSYAVTTIPGSNDAGTDRFELRRATPWDEDVFAFGLRLRYNKLCS